MTEDQRYLVLDTSCIVALLCGWHEHHTITRQAVESYLAEGYNLALAAHSLVEAYAVFTRLPPPHRMLPAVALGLLKQNFGQETEMASLTPRETWRFLADACSDAVTGGRTYDALIAASARKLDAPLLLTWNLKHLALFEDAGLTVRSPAMGLIG